ncbi:TniB family NTP-binding protein [Actinomadura luteofluorescens]
MVVSRDGAQLENRKPPTTTLDGWQRFVNADPPSFTLLAGEVWEKLDDLEREDYNETRIAYHSEMAVVMTSAIQEINTEGRLLTLVNQGEEGARRGLIVSGEATTGKTTAIKQLGRTHELRIRKRHPGSTVDRIPVVYVTAPPKGSPRKLAVEFARFLQLPPVRPRHNVTDIADSVCQVLVDARTDIVIVDEIHNINLGTAAGEDLSDHMKYFTEHLPATFVYAGIEVERSGLFTGIRGRQIAGRCVMTHTQQFPYNTEWKQLVASMEASLRLHRHEPGSLTRQAKYLHQRTGGTIGSLSHLVRKSAIRSILTQDECVTRRLMEKIRIDHAAEAAARKSTSDR